MRLHPCLRTLVALGAVLPALAFTACSGKRETVNDNAMTLSGTVTYRARIALPPDAVIRVRLDDASRPDTTTAPIAEQIISTGGRQVPIAFELPVADSLLSPTGRFALRAEIHGDGGTLMWTTSAAYELPQPALSQQNIELVVMQNDAVAATQSPSSTPGRVAGAITGAEWHLVRMQPSDGRKTTLSPDEGYTISFDAEGRYNGQAHCNRYGGAYQLTTSGSLTLTQGMSTLAACAPPSSADVYMRILHTATSLSRTNDTLRLTSPAQDVLVFARRAGQ